MRRVTLHSDAEAEMTAAAAFYEGCSCGLGRAFMDAVQEAVNQIAVSPAAYVRIGKNVRKKTLGRFPYYIIYAFQGEHVRILAIAHQRRRPFYWQNPMRNR